MPTSCTKRANTIKPWPGCSFSLVIDENDYEGEKDIFVSLNRRADGRFGRLQAMVIHLPKPKKSHTKVGDFFRSFRYRQHLWSKFAQVMQQVGVPKVQQEEFARKVHRVFPKPTRREEFKEWLNDPLMNAMVGSRKKELSYYRTGKMETTEADHQLIREATKETTKQLKKRIKGDPEFSREFLSKFFGVDLPASTAVKAQ